MNSSLFSNLPPLKCNYHLTSIQEEQPYISMNSFVEENDNVQESDSVSCCLSIFDFCWCGRNK